MLIKVSAIIVLGKGTQIWKKTGAIYDGDWKDNQRCGFVTLSVPENDVFRKVYSGGWKHDKRHVRSILFICHKLYRV